MALSLCDNKKVTLSAVLGVALAVLTPPAQAGTTPAYRWENAVVPAAATGCVPLTASAQGGTYVVRCQSLPAGRDTVVMAQGQVKALHDTTGGEKFEQVWPQRVNDSGWVYGVVGHTATVEEGGWRVARWNPQGELHLAPHTPASETHADLGAPTTDQIFAAAVSVNDNGSAVIDVHQGLTLQASAWLWHADGRTEPVAPVNPGRWTEALAIANDGTVVFNDRETQTAAYQTPLPYRRLPDGKNVALPKGTRAYSEVHAVSPNGQHIVGGDLGGEDVTLHWLTWQSPQFTANETTTLEEEAGMAFSVNDAGTFVSNTTVVHGGQERRLRDALQTGHPAGDLDARAIVADGRILAGIRQGDTTSFVGWLVPVQR